MIARWTAFGIMLGDLLDVAFYFVHDKHNVTGLNWRLMLGSAGVPALIVCCQVLFAPESPLWLIGKGRYQDAFSELCRLRLSKVQAARDLYYIHVLLEAEAELKSGRNRVLEMFTIPRNRNAALASYVVMFGQCLLLPAFLLTTPHFRSAILRRQRYWYVAETSIDWLKVSLMDGTAYYSSTVFFESGFSRVSSLLSSFGFGLINFLFALPAVFTIDTFGRRCMASQHS